MFLKLSSNIVGKLSPNIAIYRLVGTELKEFDLIMFYLKAIIASHGYHIYKETSWSNGKIDEEVKVESETNTTSLSTDPYACAIKTKNPYFNDWKTVGHIP